jgi:hypothetical protein
MNPTNEQAAILSQHDASFRIIAGAGSGKTTTLTLYVKSAIECKRCKDTEIAFITFTRLASHDIKTKVRKLIGSNIKICCGTFHSVMFRLIRDAGLTLPDPIKLYDGTMERNVEYVLEQMRLRTPIIIKVLQNFRLLVVDEFQDLDPHQFEFVSLFKQIQPALQIIAIGDLAQNIYRFRGTSNEFLRRLLQEEIAPDLLTYRLTTNFRSSAAILSAVNAVFAEEIRGGHVLPMMAGFTNKKITPMKPQYYEYTGEKMGEYEVRVVDTLVPILQEAKAASKSVVLIFPILKCQSYEMILALLSNRFNGSMDFHRIAKEDATSSIVEIKYNPRDPNEPIQCSSFHASKGLEWDVVILLNISDNIYDVRPGEIADEGFMTERINLLYVGMTRAIESLYMFANTKCGGRHRLLARIGSKLEEVIDIKSLTEEEPHHKEGSGVELSAVTDLVRRTMSHPDVYKRFITCSEHITATFHRGKPLQMSGIYDEMKQRNRELAFGTFVDWMIKRRLTSAPTLQDRLLELVACMRPHNFLHKNTVTSNIEVLIATIEDFFDRAGSLPNCEFQDYMTAVRYLARFYSRRFVMNPELFGLYMNTERRIADAYKQEDQSIRDLYILSQSSNFYVRFQMTEIRAVNARENSYQGLPEGFDEFATAMVAPAVAILQAATGAKTFKADVSVETESFIVGEIDLITDEDCLVEIKCGTAATSADLRGTSNNVNLLQVLAYVAMSRHGSIPLIRRLRKAMLVNPLTATWEAYDLDTWSDAQSLEFLNCLEEIKRRG